jgi:hypothetical protein
MDGVAAEIRSSRPVAASRVFADKGVAETAAVLPSLFSVCASAQAEACANALEAAAGAEPSPLVRGLRNLLTEAETVREHLWRVLLDWPRLLGQGPDGPAMAAVMSAFARLRTALSGKGDLYRPGVTDIAFAFGPASECLDELSRISAGRVFGTTPGEWLGEVTDARRLRAWADGTDTVAARLLGELEAQGWSALGRSTVEALPPLSSAQLEATLGGADAEGFVAEPLWRGRPAESSPYTRNLARDLVAALYGECHNGLLTRLAAQLVELAALQSRLRHGLERLGSTAQVRASAPAAGARVGVGIAQVQAARGLLAHRVVLGGGRVSDYRILAPTEWNFHPRGAVAAGLAGLPAMDDDRLRRLAGLLVVAVDPCVDYALTIA